MAKISKSEWVCLAVITAVTASPLLGDPVRGDDLLLHYYRIPTLLAQWQEGVFFSRWQPNLVFGYGSPLFNFYPPLSAYLLTLFYLLGGANGWFALALFTLLCMGLAVAGSFLSGRLLFGSLGGILMTAVTVWSPYFLLQPYGRASLSNTLALALFPWALFGMIRLQQSGRWRWGVMTAVAICAIFLSHVVSSILFVLPFGMVALLVALGDKRRLWQTAVTLACGIGLATFFWLPAFGEIGATRYAAEASKVAYEQFFAAIWQWPEPTVAGVANAPLPKSVGWVQQGVAIVAFLGVSWNVWQNGRSASTTSRWVWWGLLVGLSGLFLTSAASDFVWRLVKPLQGVQFPWRLLDMPVFWLPLGVGWLGMEAQKRLPPRALSTGTVLLLAVALLNALPFLAPPRTRLLPKQPTLLDVTAVQQQFALYGLTAWGEYSAESVPSWPPKPDRLADTHLLPLTEKIPIEKEWEVIETTPWSATITTSDSENLLVPTRLHQFPGWRLTVDGEPTPIRLNRRGEMLLPIPAGTHEVRLWFGSTPLRQVGNGVSVATAVILLGLTLVSQKRRAETAVPLATQTALPALSWGMVGLLGVFFLAQMVPNPLLRQVVDGRFGTLYQPPNPDFGPAMLMAAELTNPDELVLYWRANEVPQEAYRVKVTLLDGRGVPVKEIVNAHPGLNVMTTWEPGLLVRDVYALPLDELAAPMALDIEVGLETVAGEPLERIDSGGETAVHVAQTIIPPPAWERSATEPIANFNDQIVLLDATEIGGIEGPLIQFDLIWQSVAPVPIDYNVFIHVLTPDGELVEQSDGPPTGGVYPTSAWQPGEVVVDGRQWTTNLSPGRYLLQVGLYDLATGGRLPVTGENALGDRVILMEFELE